MDFLKRTDALCRDEQRQALVRAHPTLNGIDYVEYFEDRTASPPQYWLEVTFLKNAPAGLVGHPEKCRIYGGVRLVGIVVRLVEPGSAANRLKLFVKEPGDFSVYWLAISEDSLDPRLAAAPFSFKAGCPSPFDCRQGEECPSPALAEPVLDYLAKDYASFRRLLLDLIPQRNPAWLERNPADVGMALVELLAYTGDYLSYYQDAVGTEAYLDTCRHRLSGRRHAQLVDYRMHDGRNAWSFVHLTAASDGVVPQGAMLLTRIDRPLRGGNSPPGRVIQVTELHFGADPALEDVVVFETTGRLTVHPRNNSLRLHTWGNRDCCLPRGATGACLYALEPPAGKHQQAVLPPLKAQDYLLLEEVKGPATGKAEDAHPLYRQVVRLVAVEETADPVFRDVLVDGELQPVTGPAQAVLPLLHVTWRPEDALAFPLCLSTHHPDTGPLAHLSVARGNVIPCDHGRTVTEDLPLPVVTSGRTGLLELKLPQTPLTFQAAPPQPTYDSAGRLRQGRHNLAASVREVQPAVVLIMEFPPAETEIWAPVPHLLDSHAFDRHFVVEVDNGGAASLRFGDDEYGRRPLAAVNATARYRLGGGRAGNLGSGSLHHLVQPEPQDLVDPANPEAPPGLWPDILQVWQPLPARGGMEPESLEELRQLAPRAFQAEQFRAVTEADYEAALGKIPEVAAAKVTFRWTGSWHTVFVALHPSNPADLVIEAGRSRLRPELLHKVRNHLSRYRLAGYDVQLCQVRYVPLEIALQICVAPGHFRGDVLLAVTRALSNQRFADGSTGFFHPSRFAFGRSVFLSQLYAAVEAVAGVEAAVVTVFKRYWEKPNQELENGLIPLGAEEIARLDNDANFPEHGVLHLDAVGGL